MERILVAKNKKAFYNYHIIDRYEASKPDRKNVIDLNTYKQTKRERCPHN